MQFPLHRFEEFGPLSESELAAVRALGEPPRAYARNMTIRHEGVSPVSFFLLVDGWASAVHTLPNGGRQILKIHLPGDALGTPSMCMAQTVEELVAMTDVVVVEVRLDHFGRLFEDHPRIAARFMLSIQLERVALMDRLAAIGRTPAASSLAAFILDLKGRLEPLGLVTNGSFDIMVTQEQIADVLGLTSVHVNRTLRAMSEAGLISRVAKRLSIVDHHRLVKLAARSERPLLKGQAWLPRPR